jgi:hypothetical protein
MLGVSKNQHRWKESVDELTRNVLEEAAKNLKWAWSLDMKYPNSYPLNTSYQFAQIEERLRGQSAIRHGAKLRLPSRSPQSLGELLNEKTIKAVYEEQNQGTYKDALRQAAAGFKEGLSAWRKILRAAEGAYAIEYYAIELAPKPKVQFLHRNLLLLLAAASEDLRDFPLTDPGIAEFFDDVCPCGKGHKPDAVRKLRKRTENSARRKP